MGTFYHHKTGISFRKIERRDLPVLLELLNSTWAGRHSFPFMNMLDQEKWFDKITSDEKKMFLVAEEVSPMTEDVSISSGVSKPVGIFKILNIDWINRTADIGRDVFPDFQHKGYGVRTLDAGNDFCFEMLGLNRLDTEALETNLAARAIVLKCGYKEEGARRKAIYRGGKWVNSVFYGILRSDWEALERVKGYNGVCNLDMAALA